MSHRTGAPAALAFAFALALVTACGGASKRGYATAPASASPDAAAPSAGGSSPRGQIEHLMTSIIRDRQALGIAGGDDVKHTTTSPQPANPCAGGKAPAANTCSDVCKLKDNICANKDRICDIAENQLPGDEWAAKQCSSAKDSCTRATKRCDSCES